MVIHDMTDTEWIEFLTFANGQLILNCADKVASSSRRPARTKRPSIRDISSMDDTSTSPSLAPTKAGSDRVNNLLGRTWDEPPPLNRRTSLSARRRDELPCAFARCRANVRSMRNTETVGGVAKGRRGGGLMVSEAEWEISRSKRSQSRSGSRSRERRSPPVPRTAADSWDDIVLPDECSKRCGSSTRRFRPNTWSRRSLRSSSPPRRIRLRRTFACTRSASRLSRNQLYRHRRCRAEPHDPLDQPSGSGQ